MQCSRPIRTGGKPRQPEPGFLPLEEDRKQCYTKYGDIPTGFGRHTPIRPELSGRIGGAGDVWEEGTGSPEETMDRKGKNDDE